LANKVYRAQNPEKIRQIKKAWCSKNPEKLAEYRKKARTYPAVYDPIKASVYHQKNKDKLNARCREWRAKNHDKARELEKSYRLANPQVGRLQNQRRRALKAQAGVYKITAKDSAKILANPCFYCGKQSSHLDHVVPLALGGRHSLGNLVASCVKCNTSKNKKTIMEWRVWQIRVLRSNHN
jgi:5-methylcytosine-specific restriction endonuclease McrA